MRRAVPAFEMRHKTFFEIKLRIPQLMSSLSMGMFILAGEEVFSHND